MQSSVCAALYAPCLTASRIALPVHGVSTTRATTPEPPSAGGASQLERPSPLPPRSLATRCPGRELSCLALRHHSPGPDKPMPMRPAAQIESEREVRPIPYCHRGRPSVQFWASWVVRPLRPLCVWATVARAPCLRGRILRDPCSGEDLPHPAPARQAAPVLGIGRIDPMAKRGAPDGRRRRGRGRRAHHVRVGRSERVLRRAPGRGRPRGRAGESRRLDRRSGSSAAASRPGGWLPR